MSKLDITSNFICSLIDIRYSFPISFEHRTPINDLECVVVSDFSRYRHTINQFLVVINEITFVVIIFHMQKFNRLLLQLPNYLLIAFVVFYWLSTGVVLNPVAMVLFLILFFQLLLKNETVGLIVSGVFVLV